MRKAHSPARNYGPNRWIYEDNSCDLFTGVRLFSTSSSCCESSSLTHFATTIVATPLPTRVGQRARLGHKTVDAEDERQTGDRQMADGGNRRRQTIKPLPVTPAAPFEESNSTTSRVI